MPSRTVDREQGAERHLAAALEYIAIAESGDAVQSAYEHAADEVMAAMDEDSSLSFTEVDRRLGKPKNKGSYSTALVRWRALDDRSAGPFSLAAGKPNRDTSGARKIAREQPDTYVEAFRAAPPEARQAIAREISHAPEVRAEARKRDVEAERRIRPNPAGERPDHLYFQFESKLSSVERDLRQALSLLAEVDQAGDNEDTIDKIGRIRSLVEVIDEAYRTGKSLDTWAAELYEERAE